MPLERTVCNSICTKTRKGSEWNNKMSESQEQLGSEGND